MRALLALGVAARTVAAPAARASRSFAPPAACRRTSPASFREPLGFQQTDSGQYFVFDRRAHAVFTIAGDAAKKIVDIGAEPGRVLDPTRLRPRSRPTAASSSPTRRCGGRASRSSPRTAAASAASRCRSARSRACMLDSARPERHRLDPVHRRHASSSTSRRAGGLVSELELYGTPDPHLRRRCAPTGHEADANVHLALNVGPAARRSRPAASTSCSRPASRCSASTTRRGTLLFERHIEGPEVDEYLRTMPTRWPTRRTEDGDVLPLVPPGGPDRRRRPRGTALDRADVAVHLRLRRGRRQDPHGAVQGRRTADAQQPVLHEGRTRPGHAGLLRVPAINP